MHAPHAQHAHALRLTGANAPKRIDLTMVGGGGSGGVSWWDTAFLFFSTFYTGGKGKSTDFELGVGIDMGMDMDMGHGVRTPLSAKSQKRKKIAGKSHGGKGRKLCHSDDEGEAPESPQQGLEFLIAAVSDVLVGRAPHPALRLPWFARAPHPHAPRPAPPHLVSLTHARGHKRTGQEPDQEPRRGQEPWQKLAHASGQQPRPPFARRLGV